MRSGFERRFSKRHDGARLLAKTSRLVRVPLAGDFFGEPFAYARFSGVAWYP
jgi:hypothetical protein